MSLALRLIDPTLATGVACHLRNSALATSHPQQEEYAEIAELSLDELDRVQGAGMGKDAAVVALAVLMAIPVVNGVVATTRAVYNGVRAINGDPPV